MFSYHHPSLAGRKRHLDGIYANFPQLYLRGYSTFFPLSDHYLVGMFTLKNNQEGLRLWKFPVDLLCDESFCQQIALVCEGFNKKDPMHSWELMKLKF